MSQWKKRGFFFVRGGMGIEKQESSKNNKHTHASPHEPVTEVKYVSAFKDEMRKRDLENKNKKKTHKHRKSVSKTPI